MILSRIVGVVTLLAGLAASGCGPRVIVITGTTLGLKATPGDGQTRPPQLVVGYKRAEVAIVPVEGQGAEEASERDAASTIASFYLENHWTSRTDIRAFIGTGFAARRISGNVSFGQGFATEAK